MSVADVLMISEKRRNILLLLLEGAKSSKELQTLLNVEWPSLKHPIKELKEERFIIQENSTYRLSNIGKIMVEATLPLLDMVSTFEGDVHYWRSRDLNVVPKELAKRIGEITDYSLIRLDVNKMFEPLKYSLQDITHSSSLIALLAIVEPTTPKLLQTIAENGSKISIVVTEEYLEKIKQISYAELNKLLNLKNVNLFVFKEAVKPPQIMIADNKMTAIFFNENGKYDYMEIVTDNEIALKWGEELFIYYKDLSRPLSEI